MHAVHVTVTGHQQQADAIANTLLSGLVHQRTLNLWFGNRATPYD